MAYGPDGKINEPRVYRLNDRTTGRSLPEIEKFLKGLDRGEMQGIDATKELLKARVEQRITEVQGFRDLLRDNRNAERMKQAQQPGYMRSTTGRDIRKALTEVTGLRRPPIPVKRGVDVVGKALGAAGKLAEGLFELIDPVLTPAQKREKEIADARARGRSRGHNRSGPVRRGAREGARTRTVRAGGLPPSPGDNLKGAKAETARASVAGPDMPPSELPRSPSPSPASHASRA